jgi:5-dehydro-2-deoxygluconokinase
LSGWLHGRDYGWCCTRANACGALVVSRHGCSPAMPTTAELDYFLGLEKTPLRPGDDATLSRLHRVSIKRKQWDDLCVFAFDHRNQFFELARQSGADEARISTLKSLLVKAVAKPKAHCNCKVISASWWMTVTARTPCMPPPGVAGG